MKRFRFAVMATETSFPLPMIADGFAAAVHEAEKEGAKPEQDPAVLLLGALVSFHVHADVNSVGGYQCLINLCSAQLEHNGNLQ